MGAGFEGVKMVGLLDGDGAFNALGFDLSDFLSKLGLELGVGSIGVANSLLHHCAAVSLGRLGS